MRHHRLAVVAAFAIGATMAGGVAVAVSGSPSTLKACASKSGTLALRATKGASKGKCLHGFSPVTFNAKGRTGAKGATGAFKPGDLKIAFQAAQTPAEATQIATVSCPTGKIAVSGGADWSNTPAAGGQAINDRPTLNPENEPGGWTATFVNTLDVSAPGTVWAICTT